MTILSGVNIKSKRKIPVYEIDHDLRTHILTKQVDNAGSVDGRFVPLSVAREMRNNIVSLIYSHTT